MFEAKSCDLPIFVFLAPNSVQCDLDIQEISVNNSTCYLRGRGHSLLFIYIILIESP